MKIKKEVILGLLVTAVMLACVVDAYAKVASTCVAATCTGKCTATTTGYFGGTTTGTGNCGTTASGCKCN